MAGNARLVINLWAGSDFCDLRWDGNWRGSSRSELSRAEKNNLADRLDTAVDCSLDRRILEDELALGIDCDHSDEKKQADGGADKNADDEHEAIEKLLVLVSQGIVLI
jgi:hypothetical protein